MDAILVPSMDVGAGAKQGIDDARRDVGKLMGSLNADSVQVLLRNMGKTMPGVGQAMQHMQEALRQHGEASKAQGGGGEA